MIWLTTFSDHNMNTSRARCIASAREHGVEGVAGPHLWEPSLETRDGFTFEWLKGQPIFEQFNSAFWASRGCGYFLWKPYLIDLVMSKLQDGDYLVYSDAGIEFIDNIRYIVDRMDQDVWLFGNNWEHAHWCKRDVIDAVWPAEQRGYSSDPTDPNAYLFDCWAPWLRFRKQAQASVIFFRVSDYSRKFVKEWLDWCLCSKTIYNTLIDDTTGLPLSVPVSEARLIDDSPSIAPNHPEFREHRHDQAILTTLAYREGIKLHYWPAVYNKGGSPEFVYEKLPEYAGDTYPVLFHHHRRRNEA